MKEVNKHQNDPEALRFEIELKKAKLNLKTGMRFETNPDNELPPEIESAFLDSVARFEDAWQNAKKIKVFDKLKQPHLRKSEELGSREISEELKKVRDLLREHDMYLDTLCPVDDRLLYEFITEELMQHEMDDLNIPDMMIGFTYEEFHPNHEYNIKQELISFVNDLLKKSDFEFTFTHKYVANFEELRLFCDAFESVTLHHFNISEVEITNNKAEVSFQTKFSGRIDRTSGSIVFNGPGNASLEFNDDYWCLVRVELPV